MQSQDCWYWIPVAVAVTPWIVSDSRWTVGGGAKVRGQTQVNWDQPQVQSDPHTLLFFSYTGLNSSPPLRERACHPSTLKCILTRSLSLSCLDLKYLHIGEIKPASNFSIWPWWCQPNVSNVQQKSRVSSAVPSLPMWCRHQRCLTSSPSALDADASLHCVLTPHHDLLITMSIQPQKTPTLRS